MVEKVRFYRRCYNSASINEARQVGRRAQYIWALRCYQEGFKIELHFCTGSFVNLRHQSVFFKARRRSRCLIDLLLAPSFSCYPNNVNILRWSQSIA